MYSDLL
jgi:SNF2 family DNA or RNA helicase